MFVKNPFWIINFFLFIVFGFSSILIILLSPRNVTYSSIKKPNFEENFSSEAKNLGIDNILNRDLLNAQPSIPEEEQEPSFQQIDFINVIKVPEIPSELPENDFENEEREFLPPLQFILHGTIINSDPKKNKAFIENIRTKEEKTFSLGENIGDAQIIFIGKSKVIFIRSNGQQENLYINKNFEDEEEIISKILWDNIIKNDSEKYKVDCTLLTKRLTTVGAFLDELDLITFFEDGDPKGCQIISDDKKSLSTALGLKNGDVIIDIDGFSTSTYESRIKIYKNFINKDYSEPKNVSIKVLRDNDTIEIEYILFKSSEEDFKRSVGILALSNSVINPQRSSSLKKNVEKQIKTGIDSISNLNEKIEKSDKEIIKMAGKDYAIKR